MTDKADKIAIASWSLYDFANTIFSMNVISLYFALWVTVDQGGHDIQYSWALSGSMLVVAFSVPVFGAISDQTGNRRVPLIILTLACIACTSVIGLADNLLMGLILFAIANYAYQSSMVFYNSMLPHVARGSDIGMVSGYGVSLGYLGSIFGLWVVKPFVIEGGRTAAFIPTAVLFLVFALPCFIFVKDPDHRPFNTLRLGTAFRTLKQTFMEIKKYKNLFHFILIHFLILDVVNTVIAFMSVYANKVIGFNDVQITTFLISSTTAAMIGSFIIGWLVKFKGSIWSYWLVLGLWAVGLLIGVTSQTEAMFWVVGPLAGMGMGGVWVVSRALIVELSPPEKIGEFFGLYGLAGKMASIIGPLLWGSIVYLLETTQTLKYRAALFSLFLITLITCFLFRSFVRQLPKHA